MSLLTLAFIGWRTRKNGEEGRIMARAAELEEQRRVSDALNAVLDDMALDPKRRAYYQKRIGKACGLRDMVPRKLMLPPVRNKKAVEDSPPELNTESVNDAVKEGKDVLNLFKTGKAA